MSEFSTVAAFDFDNTLTDRDSLLFFLLFSHGWWESSYHLTILGPSFIRFLTGNLSRQGIKEKILSRFFKGKTFAEIQALGKDFAEKELDKYLRSEALETLGWHLSKGHRCLLVSASPEFYLKPWAIRHGFEAVLASRLELSPTGHVTGKILGLNCWGAEKERRLLAYLGPKENYKLYVYGDSRGDREILALADYPYYHTFQ